MSVPEAGWRVAGLGRSASFEAVRRHDIASIRIGRKVVVPTSVVWAILGLNPDSSAALSDETGSATVVALDDRRSGS